MELHGSLTKARSARGGAHLGPKMREDVGDPKALELLEVDLPTGWQGYSAIDGSLAVSAEISSRAEPLQGDGVCACGVEVTSFESSVSIIWKISSKRSREPSSCLILCGSRSSFATCSSCRTAWITSMRERTPSPFRSMSLKASSHAR